ncbi:MAG: hypothetical protein KGI42_16605 [Xanthomonadaceae bacterium]|nr:hypothetical protein [Xanthomonadaceae bacterium]
MRKILIVAAVITLSGCATTKQWAATGGSRSDGVVRLSYEYGSLETPRLDENQAVRLASERCETWGYSGADAFGGATRKCIQGGGFGGCAEWQVTKEYQCTGTGDGSFVPHQAQTDSPERTRARDFAPALNHEDSAQIVLSAQRTAKRLGCGDVHSGNGSNEYIAGCGDHTVVIQCDGAICQPIRSIRN